MQFLPFEVTDLPLIDRFQPAGWDNLVHHFTHFIASPSCAPIKLVVEDQVVAIGASLRHLDTAWLACIVVLEEHRGKGYGLAMTKELIAQLDSRVYKTIYLDATDAGYPIYQKLGFVVEDEYIHLKRTAQTEEIIQFDSSIIRPFQESDFHPIMHLDFCMSGEYRKQLLQEWIPQAMVVADNGKIEGFYLPQLGNKPIIALSRPVGRELLKYHLAQHTNVVIPASNEAAISFVTANQLTAFRWTKRMRLGTERPVHLSMLFNRVSGQLG